MTTAEMRALQQRLGASGIVIQGKEWPRKATYFKPDGEPMPNLPADPASMQRYLDRGFTLNKPKPSEPQPVAVLEPVTATTTATIVQAVNPLECHCGFISKSAFGLQAHQRKHGKEKS